MGITEETIDHWFTYHTPTGDQGARYGRVNNACKEFAMMILEVTKSGEDRDAALRSLRRLRMDVNLAIACEDTP